MLLPHLAKSFFQLPILLLRGMAGKIGNLMLFRPHSNGLVHHSWQGEMGRVREEGPRRVRFAHT